MKKIYASIFLLIFIKSTAFSQSILLDSTLVDTTTIATNLETVWELIYGSDGDIWYTERTGKVGKVNPITKQKTTLLQLNNVYHYAVGGSEAGLLGMALHPNMIDTPHVYIVYNFLSFGSIWERLVRYTYSANSLTNPVTILDNIPGADYHDGSRIIITPDRKIIMTTGDATYTILPQNNSSLCGKFLRMNLDGTVPSDNPIPNSLIWAKGSRNAQGLVLAPNGKMYSSEHGPNSDDEINIITAGANLGWPNVTGICNSPNELQFCADSNVVEPIKTWTPTIAPGGIDYYGNTIIPEFNNSLLLVTLKEKDLRVLKLNSAGTAITSEKIYFNNMYHRMRDICVAPNGDIYIGTSNHDGRAQSPFPIATDDRIIKISKKNVSTSIPNSEKNSLLIYPNPTIDNSFTINSLIAVRQVSVFNILGEEVYAKVFNSNKMSIQLPDCKKGIYIVKTILSNNQIFIQKIQVQ